MGWSDYQDPAEVLAATEAAEAMELQRAAEDARTDTLAAAVLTGLSMVADAIRAAAGLPADETPSGAVHADCAMLGGAVWCETGDDPDMDDLLDVNPRRAARGDETT